MLPLILADTMNMFALSSIKDGKSIAIFIAMAELVELIHSKTQIVCFTHITIAVVQMKKLLELLTTQTCIRIGCIHSGQATIEQNVQILDGTPLELARKPL